MCMAHPGEFHKTNLSADFREIYSLFSFNSEATIVSEARKVLGFQQNFCTGRESSSHGLLHGSMIAV